MATGVRWATLIEDNPLTLADHVKVRSGMTVADLTQALTNTITFRVFRYANQDNLLSDTSGTEVGTVGTVTVATAVSDTLISNDLWTENGGDPDDGFNLLIDIPAARFPNPLEWYKIEITITLTSGTVFKIIWAAKTTAVAGT